MGIQIGNKRFFVFLLLTPSLQYSIIPISQLGCSSWAKTPKFLYDQEVTKIFPTKLRKLQKRLQIPQVSDLFDHDLANHAHLRTHLLG